MKKILIIGGCGYIGSALFIFFLKKKYYVDTVDLEWYGNVVNKDNIRKDYSSLSRKFLNNYDVIILLAGYSSVKMTLRRPRSAFKNDVEHFVSILHKLSSQKFIYASSSSIYGNTQMKNATEEYDRYSPLNYYDLHKKIIDNYAQISGLDYYGLRLGTVCGYSPHLRIDLMINAMYDSAIKIGKIAVRTPKTNRPILGIDDLSRVVETIIEHKSCPGIYNIASFNATVNVVSRDIEKLIGGVKIIVEESKSVYNFSVSTKKFESIYQFKFTDTIETIMRSLQKNYKKAYKSLRE